MDLARGTVVVSESSSPQRQGKHRTEGVTLLVGPSTQLTRGKAPAKLADLLPGDHAVVRYAGPAASAAAVSIRLADPVRPAPTPPRPPP